MCRAHSCLTCPSAWYVPVRLCNLLLLPAQVRVLYTAPTLIRSLMQHGDHFVSQHDRSSLRILGTVGEPINPHAWDWYHQVSRWVLLLVVVMLGGGI